MLVINEAVNFSERSLKGSCLCLNQLRAAGNLVRSTPIQFDASSTHSITVPNRLELPLEMNGVVSIRSALTRQVCNNLLN